MFFVFGLRWGRWCVSKSAMLFLVGGCYTNQKKEADSFFAFTKFMFQPKFQT